MSPLLQSSQVYLMQHKLTYTLKNDISDVSVLVHIFYLLFFFISSWSEYTSNYLLAKSADSLSWQCGISDKECNTMPTGLIQTNLIAEGYSVVKTCKQSEFASTEFGMWWKFD